MTDNEKSSIINLRSRGMGYKAIAAELDVSKEAVRSYCRNHNLNGIVGEICPECGKAVIQIKGRKKMRFCSAVCRQNWWNKHPDAVIRKAVYTFSCAGCGREFTAYGNAHRKYCSHSCYINDRYKECEVS